jgi:hypothetical protein
MGDAALLERLQALINAPSGGEGAPTLDFLEHTLTDGYAQALVLEAERARVAKSIGALAVSDAASAEAITQELSLLAQRLTRAEAELHNLRQTLRALRHRATTLRSAPA